jgi:hypothetical protein
MRKNYRRWRFWDLTPSAFLGFNAEDAEGFAEFAEFFEALCFRETAELNDQFPGVL